MVPPTAPEVAFAGRSNVGKSTLLNAVCQRHGLARTSRTPGCTRGIIVFDVRLRNGRALRLVDLPGYGFAERSRAERRAWGPLIEHYLSQRPVLRGVVVLIDPRRGPEHEELALFDYLRAVQTPFILAATKIDKLARAERTVLLESLRRRAGAKVFGVSGATGEGRDELVAATLRLAYPAAEGPRSEHAATSTPAV
jgi:GTP-binding protein